MLTSEMLKTKCNEFVASASGNVLSSEAAAQHQISGLRLFDEPLFGFASADDPLFMKMKEKGVVGPQYIAPKEWMGGAKTVISIFLPFSDDVKRSNSSKDNVPSAQWLFGRIEGQQFVDEVSLYVAKLLQEQGFEAVVPNLDSRFKDVKAPSFKLRGEWKGASFTSNWSERHAAYICGLGTFGLSKGLITEKGMAGRFCSIVTDAEFPATERKYTGIYDYCIKCGACAARCPVKAISLKKGKNHMKCALFQKKTMKLYEPRYGCGKCQVCVPCESCIPAKEFRG